MWGLLVRTNVTNHWINHNKENPWSKYQVYTQLAKQNFLQASTWYQTISDAWIIRVIASPLNHFFSFFLLPPWSSKFNWCSDQSVTTIHPFSSFSAKRIEQFVIHSIEKCKQAQNLHLWKMTYWNLCCCFNAYSERNFWSSVKIISNQIYFKYLLELQI